jgi:REP element-mobilizing transposase RayT
VHVPWGLKRYQQTRQSHFVTFCCYHRRRLVVTDVSPRTFEAALERVRRSFNLRVYAYVIMPEHVHRLLSEPERGLLADALKSSRTGQRESANERKGNSAHLFHFPTQAKTRLELATRPLLAKLARSGVPGAFSRD